MAQRFLTTVPRYVDGRFVHASIEYPVEVEFPDHIKISETDLKTGALLPIDTKIEERPKLKVPYAEVRRGPPGPRPVSGNGGKRASDSEPA